MEVISPVQRLSALNRGIFFRKCFLLYTVTVLFCWSITRKLLLRVLLAVVVDVALYSLASLF